MAATNQESVSPHRLAERKRRRRELIAVGVAGATLVAFVFAQTELPPLTRHTSLVSNLAVITLFNLSFLLLGLMLFLVGRNLAKVMFERRRGLIGSKFQVRLVVGFIAVALVPSAFLLYVSGVFLHADIDSWFNPEYEQISTTRSKSRRPTTSTPPTTRRTSRACWPSNRGDKDCSRPSKRDELKEFIEEAPAGIQPRHHRGVLRRPQAAAPRAQPQDAHRHRRVAGFADPRQTLKGQAMTRTDRLGSADIIRGSAPISSRATPTTCRCGGGRLLSAARASRRARPTFRELRGLFPTANSPPADYEQLPAGAGADRIGGGAAGELVRDVSRARNHRADQAAGARVPTRSPAAISITLSRRSATTKSASWSIPSTR